MYINCTFRLDVLYISGIWWAYLFKTSWRMPQGIEPLTFGSGEGGHAVPKELHRMIAKHMGYL